MPLGEPGQVRRGSYRESWPLCLSRKPGGEQTHPDEASKPRGRTNSSQKKWKSAFSFVQRPLSLRTSQDPRHEDECIVVSLVVFCENSIRGALGRFVEKKTVGKVATNAIRCESQCITGRKRQSRGLQGGEAGANDTGTKQQRVIPRITRIG